jgi:hypothetical protein
VGLIDDAKKRGAKIRLIGEMDRTARAPARAA